MELPVLIAFIVGSLASLLAAFFIGEKVGITIGFRIGTGISINPWTYEVKMPEEKD